MTPIRVLRWASQDGAVHMGLSTDDYQVYALDHQAPGVTSLNGLAQFVRDHGMTLVDWARHAIDRADGTVRVDPQSLLLPLDLTEVWAAGVTYELSRNARESETFSGQSIYARVYDASRPELFFKAPGARVVGPHAAVGLRPDATWHVPEPELTAILDDTGELLGYTVGNDMTARDVEAENPLYLPQAKMFHHGVALGPTVVLAGTVDVHQLTIRLEIRRRGDLVVDRSVSTGSLRRPVEELVEYLGRAWEIAPWTALMTGTGIVPPDEFALEDGDEIAITIPEIGTLTNRARTIDASWTRVPPTKPRVVQIHPDDNVAVALGEIPEGQSVSVNGRAIAARQTIPFGHKIALTRIERQDWVIKYGAQIGRATHVIEPGEHVHTHNVESARGRGDAALEKGERGR